MIKLEVDVFAETFPLLLLPQKNVASPPQAPANPSQGLRAYHPSIFIKSSPSSIVFFHP